MWFMMVFTPQPEHAVAEASKEDGGVTTGADAVKTETLEGNTTLSQPNEEDPSELLTNEIVVDKGNKHGCHDTSVK